MKGLHVHLLKLLKFLKSVHHAFEDNSDHVPLMFLAKMLIFLRNKEGWWVKIRTLGRLQFVKGVLAGEQMHVFHMVMSLRGEKGKMNSIVIIPY